jgi:microcystin-dependent protein
MALIVPNATATGSSNKYSSINQAEPDSVDFEALGNTLNYIRSGGGASVGPSNALTAASGVAVIQGVPYTFATGAFTGAVSPSTRFDLLVARLSGASVSVQLLTGTDSATNPTLPQSKSTLASGVASTSANYDPATDAILATVYTVTGTPLSIASIVDKRIISTAPVTYAVSAVPTTNAKDVIGDTAIYNGDSYIKNTSSTWAKLTVSTELADAKMPIGAMFAFPSTITINPNTQIYLECLGQSLSTTAYASLFAVLGYTYGGSGSSFNLPNVTGDTGLVGAASATITSDGPSASTSNTSTVVLPQHNHDYTTVIGVKSGSANVGSKTGYPTSARTLTGAVTVEQHQHTTALNDVVKERFATIASVSTGSVIVPTDWHGEIPFYFDSNYHNGLVIYFKEDQKRTGNSNNTGGSTSITIPTNLAISTNIGTVTTETDIGSPGGTTNNTGTSGASMNILSKSVRVRWFIRWA